VSDEPSPALRLLLERVSQRLGAAIELLDARRREGRLENLTLRVSPPGRASVAIDVAHVDTFESSTWEAPPADLGSLVGAGGHTLHQRRDAVEFRLATWVDTFDSDTVALALARRLKLPFARP
jgi:hypothetical protein